MLLPGHWVKAGAWHRPCESVTGVRHWTRTQRHPHPEALRGNVAWAGFRCGSVSHFCHQQRPDLPLPGHGHPGVRGSAQRPPFSWSPARHVPVGQVLVAGNDTPADGVSRIHGLGTTARPLGGTLQRARLGLSRSPFRVGPRVSSPQPSARSTPCVPPSQTPGNRIDWGVSCVCWGGGGPYSGLGEDPTPALPPPLLASFFRRAHPVCPLPWRGRYPEADNGALSARWPIPVTQPPGRGLGNCPTLDGPVGVIAGWGGVMSCRF